MGKLSIMTQFKDKSQNIVKQDNKTEIIPTGLFVYPALMIADIILYNPKAVLLVLTKKTFRIMSKNCKKNEYQVSFEF